MEANCSRPRTALVICPIWNMNQPPLSIAYLGTVLSRNKFNVKCYDFSQEFFACLPEPEEDKIMLYTRIWTSEWCTNFALIKQKFAIDKHIAKWAQTVLSDKPHVVLISVYLTTKDVSILLARKIKQLRPETLIVFGGPECINTSLLSENSSIIDVMVKGEGETTIVELFDMWNQRERWESCAGLVFIRDELIVETQVRSQISDLDSIPFPDWSLFDMELYPATVSLPMFNSRGCIGRCSFCDLHLYWKKYRWRSAENIVLEIKRNVHEFGISRFDFVDALINGNMQEFEKLCDLIINENLNVHWGGKARINPKMDLAFLQKAKKAGCSHLVFGIESASQEVLDHMRKDINIVDAKRVIKACYEAGIKAELFFIVGYVNESEEYFRMTLKFIRDCAKYISTIYPGNGLNIVTGSIIGDNMQKYGIILEPEGWVSDNGRNTPEIRKTRVDALNNLLRELSWTLLIDKLADLNHNSFKNLVFYGAGKRCKSILKAIKKFEAKEYLPHEIWDIDAVKIGKIYDIPVVNPKFSALNDDYCILIALKDEDIINDVISKFKTQGFNNYTIAPNTFLI